MTTLHEAVIIAEDRMAKAELIVETVIDRERMEHRETKKKYRELLDLLDNAIVTDPLRPKELTTLWGIIEREEYAERCKACQAIDCEGEAAHEKPIGAYSRNVMARLD